MNRNWMALAAGLLFTLTACNTDEAPQGTVQYDPQQRTDEVAPEELFSSMEVITLQCPDEIIADTGNDLLFDAGIFYLVDRVHRKSVDRHADRDQQNLKDPHTLTSSGEP